MSKSKRSTSKALLFPESVWKTWPGGGHLVFQIIPPTCANCRSHVRATVQDTQEACGLKKLSVIWSNGKYLHPGLENTQRPSPACLDRLKSWTVLSRTLALPGFCFPVFICSVHSSSVPAALGLPCVCQAVCLRLFACRSLSHQKPYLRSEESFNHGLGVQFNWVFIVCAVQHRIPAGQASWALPSAGLNPPC